VLAADGFTYERAAIQQWLEGHDTSPMASLECCVLGHEPVTCVTNSPPACCMRPCQLAQCMVSCSMHNRTSSALATSVQL